MIEADVEVERSKDGGEAQKIDSDEIAAWWGTTTHVMPAAAWRSNLIPGAWSKFSSFFFSFSSLYTIHIARLINR